MAERLLPKVHIYSRISDMQESIRAIRNLPLSLGSLPMVPDVVVPQYPWEFQRNTIFHAIETQVIRGEIVSADPVRSVN